MCQVWKLTVAVHCTFPLFLVAVLVEHSPLIRKYLFVVCLIILAFHPLFQGSVGRRSDISCRKKFRFISDTAKSHRHAWLRSAGVLPRLYQESDLDKVLVKHA